MNWTATLATATVVLAFATVWLALEGRTARIESTRRNRVLVFRAALLELASNIQTLETWDPAQQQDAPPTWPEKSLAFESMRNLLAQVWLPGSLWDRIMTLVTNLRAYMDVVTAQIRGLPPDAASRGEYTPQRNNIRVLYYLVDLYLKQLACYLIAEMRRQGLVLPKDWRNGRPIFTPASWRYDAGFESVAQAVFSIESGHVWRPFTLQAPEPNDPAYRNCRLERLIEQAGQRSKHEADKIRIAGGRNL